MVSSLLLKSYLLLHLIKILSILTPFTGSSIVDMKRLTWHNNSVTVEIDLIQNKILAHHFYIDELFIM